MAKKKLTEKEFGMDMVDPMECLFYERQEYRKKAYLAKRRKGLSKNRRESLMVGQMGMPGVAGHSQTPSIII